MRRHLRLGVWAALVVAADPSNPTGGCSSPGVIGRVARNAAGTGPPSRTIWCGRGRTRVVPALSRRPGPTRQERPGGGHHRHEPEDTHRHPDQRWPLGQHRADDQHQQPDREDHRRDDPPVPPHRREIEGPRETGIGAVQRPLDLIQLPLLVLGKRHRVLPFPGADHRDTGQRYPLPEAPIRMRSDINRFRVGPGRGTARGPMSTGSERAPTEPEKVDVHHRPVCVGHLWGTAVSGRLVAAGAATSRSDGDRGRHGRVRGLRVRGETGAGRGTRRPARAAGCAGLGGHPPLRRENRDGAVGDLRVP